MWFLYILWTVGSLSAIVSLVILFSLVSFMVKSRAKQDEFNSDLVMMISGFEAPSPVAVQTEETTKAKTWDEKYEEELAAMERRLRGDSGLQDLPGPKATFGEPPASNTDAQEGLTFREPGGNMR